MPTLAVQHNHMFSDGRRLKKKKRRKKDKNVCNSNGMSKQARPEIIMCGGREVKIQPVTNSKRACKLGIL